MVLLAPPSPGADIIAGTLVILSGLKSAEGRQLNGKNGLVRGKNDEGRFEVEILGTWTNDSVIPENPRDLVNIKASNVRPLSERNFLSKGRPLFTEYVRRKGEFTILMKGPTGSIGERVLILSELYEQAWFEPTIGDNLKMAMLMRNCGQIRTALAICRMCVEDISPSSPHRQPVYYNLALTLVDAQLLDHAMVAAAELVVDVARPLSIYRKQKVLELIERQVDPENKFAAAKVRAIQEWEAMPKDWQTMQKVGAALCDMRDFDIGIRYYERALERVPDNEALKEKLQFARLQFMAQQGDGTAFAGYGTDADGKAAPVYYVDAARARPHSPVIPSNVPTFEAPRHSS